MSESSLSVTPGSGLDLRTDSRTIDSETRHQQYVLHGEGSLTTYTATAENVAVTTSGDHVFILQGDGTNYTRIRRIRLMQRALAGPGRLDFRVLRTSTAGTGGTTVNCRPFDEADTNPYAGVAMTRPSSKGTEGVQLLLLPLGYVNAQPVDSRNVVEWRASPGDVKPIIIGNSTANGICIKVNTGVATVTVDIEVEFTVSTWK